MQGEGPAVPQLEQGEARQEPQEQQHSHPRPKKQRTLQAPSDGRGAAGGQGSRPQQQVQQHQHATAAAAGSNGGARGSGPVDVFGQQHPAKATEVVTCRNCGRQVQAGTFAPHLEKCMGKGRAAGRAASKRLQQTFA